MATNNVTALQDMALFVEVGRTLSFRKAGLNLGIPAATLSRRISALETALGVALFQRSTRVVTLTEIGQLQFERCEHLVDQAMHVMNEFTEAAIGPTGHLRVSMPVDLGVRFIGPLIPGFRQLYPNITFDLDLDASNKNMSSDGFDIAIRLEPIKRDSKKSRSIGTITLGLYASPSYLNTIGNPLKPESLIDHDCLLMKSRKLTETWQLRSLKSGEMTQISVRGNYRCNHLGLVSYFAEQGFGIAKLANATADVSVKEGKLQRVLPEWEIAPLSINFISSNAVIPASVRVFRDYLSKKISYLLQ